MKFLKRIEVYQIEGHELMEDLMGTIEAAIDDSTFHICSI